MKVVVTGATGFLGGHLCAKLRRSGYEVMGIGRNKARGEALTKSGVRFHACDLSRPFSLPDIDEADAVIHAAALSSAWGKKRDFVRANVTATERVLDWASALQVKRFIHISSPSVAFRFEDQLDLPEASPLPTPVNAYAATKARAEALVRERSGLNPLILRPRGIYGAGDVALLPRLIRAARKGTLPLLREGAAVTDLTHVDDVCRAIRCALSAPAQCAGRIYNISGGEPLKVTNIIEKAAQAAGVEARFKPVSVNMALMAARTLETLARITPGRPEPPITAYGVGVLAYSQTLDLSAARKGLGYEPQVSFEEGMRLTFEAPARA